MLTNVEKVKQYLGKADSDTQDDDLIFELTKRVQDSIEHFCDRRFDARIYQEYYKGDGSNRLLLRQYPIISISGVASGEMVDAFGNVTTATNQPLGIWDDVDYVFTDDTKKDSASVIPSYLTPGLIQLKGDIFINSEFWSFYNLENLKVVYKAGYSVIPPDIEDNATIIVAVEFARSKGIINSVNWTKDPKEILADVWDDLTLHRRIR